MSARSSSNPDARPMLLYAVLIAVSTTGPLALNIFVPSIPGLMREFSASSGSVQLTLTVYLAGIAISQLFYGPLSDRYGRRPVMLAGLTLFVTASHICTHATSIETLMAARFVQALGGAAGMVLARAIIRDLHGREAAASVLGYITMAWVLVPMFAPALGGLLEETWSWQASFHVLSIFGALVLVLVYWKLPETNPPAKNAADQALSPISGLGPLIVEPRFVSYTLTLGFCSAVFFSFLAGAPFIMVEVLGRSPLDYGLWFMLISVGYMTGNFLSGRYSQLIGIDRMITYGNVLALAGSAAMLSAALSENLTPITLFVPMVIVTLGNGLTVPNGTAAAISVIPGTIGAAAGLSGFTQMTIGAAASQLTGTLQGDTPLVSIWIMAAAALLATTSHQLMRYRYPSH